MLLLTKVSASHIPIFVIFIAHTEAAQKATSYHL